MFRHILVPTDGSPASQEAARNAVVFAKECGARITALHVKPAPQIPFYVEGARIDHAVIEQFAEIIESDARKHLDFVDSLCQAVGVKCTRLIESSDDPYQAIIDAASRNACDLIFMGSHGRSGIAGLLMGSVTSKVLTHCKIPVLVFR